MKLKHRSDSAARGKFALLNASGWAVPPLCEDEVVYEIGKIVVLNPTIEFSSPLCLHEVILNLWHSIVFITFCFLQEGVH